MSDDECMVLVICPLKPKTLENSKIPLYYRPDLEYATGDAWKKTMEELGLQAIIYGTGFFTRSIRIWSENNKNKLSLSRLFIKDRILGSAIWKLRKNMESMC